MRARYQRGYLRLGHRKTGPDCWEFLWWDTELTGDRVRRKALSRCRRWTIRLRYASPRSASPSLH